MRSTTRLAAAGIFAAAALVLTACSSGTGSSATDTSSSMTSSSPSASMNPAADLVGPGCAAYAKQVPAGAGSVEGMAQDPVATAASNNPLLTQLVAAVSGKLNASVNLVDTLNSGQFTVFAPVDDAFKKIDPATIDMLKTERGRTDADQHPDVPRRPRSDRAEGHRRHPQDRRGRHRHRHGLGRQPEGERRQRHLRRRAHGQRHGLPHRLGADASRQVTGPALGLTPRTEQCALPNVHMEVFGSAHPFEVRVSIGAR